MMLSPYEKILIEGWEETYKKAQLILWVMLALRQSPMHMSEVKEAISIYTNGTIVVDDKSMYRALRRFAEAELVEFRLEKSESGPDRKIYNLTTIGKNVLQTFLERNINGVYFVAKNKQLFS